MRQKHDTMQEAGLSFLRRTIKPGILGRGERRSPNAGTSAGPEPGEARPTELCVFDQERPASAEPPLALSGCG